MATRSPWRTLLSLGVLTLTMMGHAAQAEDIPIVTGQQWTTSTVEAKNAYLIGIANLIDVERAYYAKTGQASDKDIAPRFAKGMQGQTLDSVRQGVDNWYAANPGMIQHPVIETIWFEMVLPGLQKNQ